MINNIKYIEIKAIVAVWVKEKHGRDQSRHHLPPITGNYQNVIK